MERQIIKKTIKAYLLARYTERRRQKMAKRQPINLRLLPTSEGTSDETSRAFIPIGSDILQGHITGVFEEVRGRLLITGEPGTGKTGILLQLVVGLLEREMDSLPVLLNLATWRTEYNTLDTWLQEILPAELGRFETTGKKYIGARPVDFAF
jgi:predicted ATP-dependent serine protease